MALPKLLIVEDNTAIRNMIKSLFSNHNYEVVEADNGATGLQEARLGGFSAILLDLKMPQMDGITFLKNLKQTPPQQKNGPIIVFSSVEYEYARDEALREGATAFIVKDDPELIHLVEKVEELIQLHQQ